MKWSFLALAVTITFLASAQNDSRSSQPRNIELPQYYFSGPHDAGQPGMATLPDSLVNGNKIYYLPQDNMPCVVPNMATYNMPVLKPKVVYTIPNPAYPSPRSGTDAMMEQLLKKLKEDQGKVH